MKRFVLTIILLFSFFNVSQSQEWLTSFDVAKRLALVQNKMLFVVWEESLLFPYNVMVKGKDSISVLIDLSQKDDDIDEFIWEYFIPVILSENEYDKLYSQIEDKRSTNYIGRFNDDSIKIMDPNGNILNLGSVMGANEGYIPLDLIKFVKTYALNLEYLKAELVVYKGTKNFAPSYNLGSKYLDFACLVGKEVRKEVIGLANIYLDEAREYLDNGELSERMDLKQKLELLELKEYLILNSPKKVLRQLKKFDKVEVAKINERLFSFLNYTALLMIGKENEASVWRSKLSSVDLKKSAIIVNNRI